MDVNFARAYVEVNFARAYVEVNFARAYAHVWMLILLVRMSMCGC